MKLEIDAQLQLKQVEKTDAEAIFNTIDSQREYLGKWLPFVAYTKTLTDTQTFVDAIVNAPETKFEYVFTIQKNGEFVGLIGFKDTDRLNQKTEIGYWLSEAHQKQGIMTRSVAKLCDFAFQELGLNRIQIKCAEGNISSSKIPQSLGFKLEGIEREGEILTGNVFTDLQIYSKLKSDQ
ncbi:GNAT family N-acetyltransferase [Zunongwangia pacifica]|uniref:GNAT family N-acetyltransferase n=1 Tax=Zunongwangia pacifica TaxID=2911062 RepID=A0A9X2CR16_9FLAO|nr:GNAT family protein [Zunongwangia pacifica]MCL6220697.1 GNAT family N-acetyltransferase [Zunongwangia pacifica]